MKKNIITVFVVLIALNGFAQEKNADTFKKQLTFGVLGNTGLFIYKSGLDKKHTKRISFGGDFVGFGADKNPPKYGVQSLTKATLYDFYLGYGVQKNVKIADKLDFFYGIDFLLGTEGRKITSGWEMIDSVLYSEANDGHSYQGASNGDFDKKVEKDATEYSLGFRPMLNVNYRVHKRIQIGVEYGINILKVGYNLGGKVTRERKITGIETQYEYESGNSWNTSASLNGRTAVTITYSF